MLAILIRCGYPAKARTAPTSWGDTHFDASWTMEAIDAPGAWLVPTTGRSAVAVVDTGVYLGHTDLAGVWVAGGAAWTDTAGHGTAVAGVIAATHCAGLGVAGVCPEVGLASFLADEQWLDALSVPAIGYTPRVDRIREALAQVHRTLTTTPAPGIHAVALAKAGARATAKEAEDECRTYFLAEIRDLIADDLVVVLGCANERVRADRCVPAAVQGLLGAPAGLLVVSSSDPPWGGPWERNAGPCYPGQSDVDVWAPGGMQTTLGTAHAAAYNEIPASGASSGLNAGNSLAIPHVAGLAALLVRVDPTLRGAAIGRLIRETAEDQVNAGQSPPIRVVNAFAAALRAHNRVHVDAPLAGYRVMIPRRVAGVTGREELEGAVLVLTSPGHSDRVEVPFVCVPKIGSEYAFCRFTAPAGLPLFAELQHAPFQRGGTGVRRVLWRGELKSLIGGAPPGAADCAWSHPACPELRTIRLQGLALTLVHDGDPQRPIAGARLRLRHGVNGQEFTCETASDGSFVLPFVEPGPHVLDGGDIPGMPGGVHIPLTLDKGTIYIVDPPTGLLPFMSVALPRRGPWIDLWAGEIELAGTRRPGARCDEVAGALTLTMGGKSLDRGRVLDRCIAAMGADHDSYDAYVAEFGPFTAEEMPEFGRRIARVFSRALWRLTGAPTTEAQEDAMSSVIDSSLLDWKEIDLPPGFVVARGGDGLTCSLDMHELGRRFLEAHFARPDEVAFPPEIDLGFAWSIGYQTHPSADETTDYELRIAFASRTLVPMRVPVTVVPQDGWPRRWRLVAGPLAGPIALSLAPGSPLRLTPDPGPAPPGCTCALVEEPEETVPDTAQVYAIGPAGEVAVISRWASPGPAAVPA